MTQLVNSRQDLEDKYEYSQRRTPNLVHSNLSEFLHTRTYSNVAGHSQQETGETAFPFEGQQDNVTVLPRCIRWFKCKLKCFGNTLSMIVHINMPQLSNPWIPSPCIRNIYPLVKRDFNFPKNDNFKTGIEKLMKHLIVYFHSIYQELQLVLLVCRIYFSLGKKIKETHC